MTRLLQHFYNFGKQRLVINFNQPDLSHSPSFYNSNRLIWQSVGITRIRRHRWPVACPGRTGQGSLSRGGQPIRA